MTRYKVRQTVYLEPENVDGIELTLDELADAIAADALQRPFEIVSPVALVDGKPLELTEARARLKRQGAIRVGRPRGSTLADRRDDISAWWLRTPTELRGQEELADFLKVDVGTVAAYFDGRYRAFRAKGELPPQ